MIPCDHFVRFYNEVFKKLDQLNALDEYYQAISKHQELHCLEDFRTKGLQGVYDYYVKIRREENCDLDMRFADGGLVLFMKKCPSLSKAMDNDAGVCLLYCDHCPGWTLPLYVKAGLFHIFDLMGRKNPQCCQWLFDHRTLAEAKLKELKKDKISGGGDPSEIMSNF